MERILRGRYTKEFRMESVRLIVEDKLPQREVSGRLNVSDNNLQNWLNAYRQGNLAKTGKNYGELSATDPELSPLRWKRVKVKMERDFFKKTVAYFT